MIELGHLSLICGMILSGFHGVLGFFSNSLDTFNSKLLSRSIFIFFLISFGGLFYAHVINDFSVIVVAENSHSLMPLIYKMSGIWGYHQGSALLWLVGLSFCGAFFWHLSTGLPALIKIKTTAIQSTLIFLYSIFVIFSSNPFLRHVPFPSDGLGLNPLLQDSGLTYHPPTLFGGHVFLSIIYALTVAVLWKGSLKHLSFLRPWALAAFAFLTMGILMGSFWAYYVLGWGGWWFWDPVEVLSLLPWLILLGLLHSLSD
jgi:cytochrome c-type biogenesis protein CcmF